MSDHEYDIRDLFRSTNKLLVGGFALLIMVVLAIGVIANSSRLFARGAGDSVQVQTRNQARSACITDLTVTERNYYGHESDAIASRLAVLDGTDPRKEGDNGLFAKIPLVESDGQMVPDPNITKVLSIYYTNRALDARDARIEAAKELEQPRLNEVCGVPVTRTDQITN